MDFAGQDDTGYSEAWRGAARGGLSVLDVRSAEATSELEIPRRDSWQKPNITVGSKCLKIGEDSTLVQSIFY